uniref:Myb-like domain-containing protein n=1 Tax=Davidia involucrata TaxID=16924 RepID=A0A5B7BBA1_DAVIN
MNSQDNAYYTNLLYGGSNRDDPYWTEDYNQTNQYSNQSTEPSQISTQTESTTKKTQRSGNFRNEEDMLLVSAWLNISLDAVQGNEQKSKKYWERIWEYFHKYKKFTSERSPNSLMHRWSAIQLSVNKFCGCYVKIETRHQSGLTEQDKGYQRSKIGSETRVTSPSAVGGDDQIPKLEEDSYTVKATMEGKELIQKQKLQLIQLVHLLRQIETQVNSSQNDILQTLADHRASIHKFFQRATAYISAIHHSGQNHGTFLITVLKLLQAIFNHVGVALESVEGGVEDLMHELAEQMCNPMVEYVKGLKTEMTSGTCPRLLAIVEEMGGAMRDGRLELEEARKKVRIAEEKKLEALNRLKESEERGRRMKEYLGLFLEAKKGSMEHSALHKLLGMGEDQAKDEKLLWELLKKKRKSQISDSPLGTKELTRLGPNNKHFKSTGVRASISHRSIASNCSRGLSPQTPCLDYWLPLGSSPSVATHQVLSCKRVTP